MRLVSVTQEERPGPGEDLRITGRVEKRSGEILDVWFEVPSELRDGLAESANPWLVCMLPHALDSGEDIATGLPADSLLLENLKGLQAIWRGWYPSLPSVRIDAPRLQPPATGAAPRRSAAFFSGGVDSWFTILRHSPEVEPTAVGRVEDLINVHGFDIPLDSAMEFQAMRLALSEGADAIGRKLVVVRTNLRQPGSLWHRGWGWLTNAAGLAATALIVEKRYSTALIGSSHSYDNLFPWGSHPLTDPLLSTSSLRILHDGAAFDRVEKTALIARHEVALANLHVCWTSGNASNCGRCPKCIRTMATLSMVGAAAQQRAFPREFELRQLSNLYVPDRNEDSFVREIRRWAIHYGRADVEQAARHALRRSRMLRPLVGSVNFLGSTPFLWRFRDRLGRLLAGTGKVG